MGKRSGPRARDTTPWPRSVQGEGPMGHWSWGNALQPHTLLGNFAFKAQGRRDSLQRSPNRNLWEFREPCTSLTDQLDLLLVSSLIPPSQPASMYSSWNFPLLCTAPSVLFLLFFFFTFFLFYCTFHPPLNKATWMVFAADSLWALPFSTVSLSHGVRFISCVDIRGSLSIVRKRHFWEEIHFYDV